jgi:hypothetical protein
MPVYLVHAPEAEGVGFVADFAESFVLWDGAALVESDESQSEVYHAVKWRLPDGAPLFVARLDHQPKFKGAEAGALKWVRGWFDGMTA